MSDLITNKKTYTFIENSALETDIFFYIDLKKKNCNLIYQLEETINLCNEIVSHINDNCVYNYHTVDLMNFYEKINNEVKKKMDILKNIQEKNDIQIYEICEHIFVTDIIDINPEKEKTICYCKICELTKK
jgi:hypothetical protein